MSVCVFSVSSGLRLLPCIAFCGGFVGFVLSGWACPFWCLCCPACRPSLYVTIYIDLQRETEGKARQPETKLGAIAQTRHIARLRNAKRSRAKHPKPKRGARDRPEQFQLRAGRDRASGPASGTRRDVRARPTQGRVAPAKGNAKLPERPRDEGGPREARPASLHCPVGQVPELRQGWGLEAPEGLDRNRHAGQGGGHQPIRTPLGGVPGSGREPGGTRSAPSKVRSRRVDMMSTHHDNGIVFVIRMRLPRSPRHRSLTQPLLLTESLTALEGVFSKVHEYGHKHESTDTSP
jgi:hypothetical protein